MSELKCRSGCGGGGDVAVMEVARSMDSSGSGKRRKVGSGELRLSPSKSVVMKGCESEDGVDTSEMLSDDSVKKKKEELSGSNADEISFCSGEIPASCCSSDGSITEKLKCADLEEISGIETIVRGNSDRRDSLQLQVKPNILSPNSMATFFTKPETEFKAESGELESFTTEKPPAQTPPPPEKTPPAAELEEFFAAAEKDLQKDQNRFKDKYNYDIVNDVPLKGRFEWVPLKAKVMKDETEKEGEEEDDE
ncbi:hypothetical protein SSX86_014394 [Deinandra increscens subsp. villosa]|uniref:Cyclin-dependent kinase inhibitor domain-containing protein n=1 Tax=Deinandra increscens subsp. villosa TaxID=3103831 RepID=A0AAP0D6F7_9ASTR